VSWAAKNQDGERGKTRRAFARSGVLFAHAAQQVDGGGVQAIATAKVSGAAAGFWA